MDAHLMNALGNAGAFAAIAIASLGSGLGTGVAGASAVGAWKKCYAQNKPAPFQLVVFAGAPLSQTIYGMIMMFLIIGKVGTNPNLWPFYLIFGVLTGLGLCISSWMQGVAGAGACDAFADNGKGFVNYLMVLGIIETVSIFVMAFGIVLLTALN
jgi:V/A-type H+/Na+-transporting ATPase subunit K